MIKKSISSGVVHGVPVDLYRVLSTSPRALAVWQDITPLARNEWICWITSVKKDDTRRDHIRRAIENLAKGKRRPCCWAGCPHRTDKSTSSSQKFVLSRRSKK